MSDELDEELVYTRVAESARKVPLSGRLAGAGRMVDEQVEHLAALWWDEQVKDRADRMGMAVFVAHVYRCARIREREDQQREETRRNKRLAENIAAGSDSCDLDEVIRYARGNGAAFMHVPGPRAAQLADEVVRLREQVAEFERLRTLGGPPPPVDTQWGNRRIEPPAPATDPAAPRLIRDEEGQR